MGPLCASEPALVPAGVAGPVTSLVIGPQGRMAAAAGAAVLLLPPSGAGVSAHTLLRPAPDSAGKPIACLAASHDGTLLAAGERGAKPGLYLYRLPAGPCGGVVPPAQELARAQHNFGIQALSFSPSGRLVGCGCTWVHDMHTEERPPSTHCSQTARARPPPLPPTTHKQAACWPRMEPTRTTS